MQGWFITIHGFQAETQLSSGMRDGQAYGLLASALGAYVNKAPAIFEYKFKKLLISAALALP